MPRSDLLALTLDDLTVLSNRGLVNRAQRELDSGVTYELTQHEETVIVRWSDDVKCILPPDTILSDRHCTCTATTICRHLIRSILAYQRHASAQSVIESDAAESEPPLVPEIASQTWSPGQISDADLAQYFNSTQLKRLKHQFEAGQVIEVMCSTKPTARLHTLGRTLRFLVPGLRYTYCDCSEIAPCSHVPLAVWAFRRLSPDRQSGIVSTDRTGSAPVELLDDIEDALHALLEVGLTGSQALIGRLQRLEERCRGEQLIWPAEILAELLQQSDRFAQRDARFSPTGLVELVGELCIRSDAIRSNTGAVPQLFIRGAKTDRLTDIGAARLIGLGCGVQVHQRSVVLTTYFQDTDSGTAMVLSRDFVELPTTTNPPREFWQLAQTLVLKQVSLVTLGAGQLLIKGGKTSPNFQLIPGRAQVVVNPQTFKWEALRAPLLVEDFAELQVHLSLLPPASLRPRRLTENLHVLAIAHVKAVEFSATEQAVTAILSDRYQNTALLYFPYTNRAHIGTEALLSQLTQMPLCFVAGVVHLRAAQVIITPVSLVFQIGNSRTLLQPWIHSPQSACNDRTASPPGLPNIQFPPAARPDPIRDYLEHIFEAIAELLIAGLDRVDSHTIEIWQNLYDEGKVLGFTTLLNPVLQLINLLRLKSNTLDWNYHLAAREALKLSLLVKVAQDQ